MITIEQIENLVASKEFQQLKHFQEKTNVFTIVGQTHTEHWHSSFISWLLDPNSSMCLGYFPLVRLLTLYMIKKENADLTLGDIYEMHLNNMHFETEKTFTTEDGKKRSIDVYGESDELIVVIENKVKARENMNGTDVGQTKDYRDYVEKTKNHQKCIYLFITPDPSQHPYDDKYTQITYQELFDYVIKKCIEHPNLNKDARYLLEQYANNLREPVHNSPMALVNIELCKKIYENNQSVLDELFQKVECSINFHTDKQIECLVYNRYQSVFDEIFLSLDEKQYGRTPNSFVKRRVVTFNDLYQSGKIEVGTEFVLEYDGVVHYARAEYTEDDKACYLLILDENKNVFKNSMGIVVGYYKTSSQAGVDVINLYRKRRGVEKRIDSLNGLAYWKTKDGVTLKSIVESL